MEELTEKKSCPIKSFCRSKTFIITLACLLCFFIGFYAGNKSASSNNKSRVTIQSPRGMTRPQLRRTPRAIRQPNQRVAIPRTKRVTVPNRIVNQRTTKPQVKVTPTKSVAKKNTQTTKTSKTK